MPTSSPATLTGTRSSRAPIGSTGPASRPPLSDSTAAVTLEACKAAKARGVKISCDLNYRKNLWSREKAGQVMGELVPYVDVLIANEEDSADVFGIHAEHTDINSGKLDVEGYKSVARQLVERFHCEKVAITLRESLSASDNNWSGMLYDGATGEISISKKYAIRIVDRVGGGDSFGSGLIYALLSGYDNQGAVEYAAAASALKHTIEGDFNMVSVAEVKSLMGGNASGRGAALIPLTETLSAKMAAIENRGQPQQEFLLRLSLLFSWGVVRWKQTNPGRRLHEDRNLYKGGLCSDRERGRNFGGAGLSARIVGGGERALLRSRAARKAG